VVQYLRQRLVICSLALSVFRLPRRHLLGESLQSVNLFQPRVSSGASSFASKRAQQSRGHLLLSVKGLEKQVLAGGDRFFETTKLLLGGLSAFALLLQSVVYLAEIFDVLGHLAFEFADVRLPLVAILLSLLRELKNGTEAVRRVTAGLSQRLLENHTYQLILLLEFVNLLFVFQQL